MPKTLFSLSFVERVPKTLFSPLLWGEDARNLSFSPLPFGERVPGGRVRGKQQSNLSIIKKR